MSAPATAAALGLMIAGPLGGLAGGAVAWLWARRRARPSPIPEPRLVMVLLLVEIRSGSSVLAALQRASARLPSYPALHRVARVATVSGLVAALSECDDALRPIVAQLARAQRSGSSLDSAVRRMLDQDLASFRSGRLARARALPVKLMVPVTLLMLPGLVLLLYAPALIRTFSRLTGSWP